MDHQQNCEIAATLIDRMAVLLRDADLATPVPTCPGWDLSRLVVHVGGIHRWAAQLVESRAPERVAPIKTERGSDLIAWLGAGALAIADMVSANPRDAMWSWGKDQHVAFWSRRLVHETAVHYADAAIALGVEPDIDAAIASDGIDEFLENLPYATFAANIANLKGSGSIHLHGTDSDVGISGRGEWTIQLTPSGFTFDHAHGKGTVAVRGTTTDLCLMLHRRYALADARFEIFGDASVMKFWLENSSL